MHHSKGWIGILSALLLAANLWTAEGARAAPARLSSPSELIAAVNNLRLARGASPLSVHSVLMQTAQGQADALLATGGAVGHTRPNGMTYTQQLILLGYPLAGDLSLGGYRSENFVFGYQLSAADAVEAWLGDQPHTDTMLSSYRSDIGAGVAAAGDGTVYYVIDTALRTTSGLPQSDANLYLPGGGAQTLDPQSAVSQYIVPVAISTARPNGDVYHPVQYGQTLWAIAIEYGVKIDQIRVLNHLGSGNTVYPNQLLLVKQGATQPAAASALLPAPAYATPLAPTQRLDGAGLEEPVSASTRAAQVPQPASPAAASRAGRQASFWIALALFALIAGGGVAAWFIRDPGK
ncbi:MAG: CAP domain-containing protein [Bacteroidota bacterium]